MLSKFKGVRDEELVSMYKSSRDDDVETELIDRYRIHSKKLAGELYQTYRFVFQVEYEDLFQICLMNLFTAIKTAKTNVHFFKFWKTVSTNEVKIYISTLPLLKRERNIGIISTSRDISNNEFVIASPVKEESNIDLSSEVERILQKGKDTFDPNDMDIFILYSAGYSITDIAKETGLKYYYVRSRINIIKDKMSKYFAK